MDKLQQLIRILLALIGIYFCIGVGLFFSTLVPMPEPHTTLRSGVGIALVVFGYAFFLAYYRHWPANTFFLVLLLFLPMTFILIIYFSGKADLDRFNLNWLFGLSLPVVLPWLAGLAVAHVINKKGL